MPCEPVQIPSYVLQVPQSARRRTTAPSYPMYGVRRSFPCEMVGNCSYTSEHEGRKNEPPARSGHTLVMIDAETLLMFGGGPDEHVSNNVYELRLTKTADGQKKATCQHLLVSALNRQPKERDRHSSWAFNGSMYIFGGEDACERMYNDLWQLDYAAKRWKKIACKGAVPSARRGQTSTLVGAKAYFFGGLTHTRKAVSDVHSFDLLTNTFTLETTSANRPCGRRGHSATHIDGSLYVYGGCDQGEDLLGDLWRLDLETMQWEEMHSENRDDGPPPSAGHGAAVFKGMLMTFGGNICQHRREASSELRLFDVKKRSWSQLAMKDGPRARSYHALVATSDSEVITFGGWSGHFSMNDVVSISDGCDGSLKHLLAQYMLSNKVAYKSASSRSRSRAPATPPLQMPTIPTLPSSKLLLPPQLPMC